ncbi:hypothetical protein ACOMHN_012286 [Nucella lapillus]
MYQRILMKPLLCVQVYQRILMKPLLCPEVSKDTDEAVVDTDETVVDTDEAVVDTDEAVVVSREVARGQENPLEPWTPEPQFLPSQTEVTARQGDRAVLPCGIHNLGTKQSCRAAKLAQHYDGATSSNVRWKGGRGQQFDAVLKEQPCTVKENESLAG